MIFFDEVGGGEQVEQELIYGIIAAVLGKKVELLGEQIVFVILISRSGENKALPLGDSPARVLVLGVVRDSVGIVGYKFEVTEG